MNFQKNRGNVQHGGDNLHPLVNIEAFQLMQIVISLAHEPKKNQGKRPPWAVNLHPLVDMLKLLNPSPEASGKYSA